MNRYRSSAVLLRLSLMLVITLTRSFKRSCVRQLSALAAESSSSSSRKIFRTLQVQVVHRHGDRSPITPMKDEVFWSSTLIPPDLQEKIAQGTTLIQSETENTHKASGRGPFGKLSHLGLLQMIQLGNTLREQLLFDDFSPSLSEMPTDGDGNILIRHIWSPKRPLHPRNIRVISTDFPRTIQSVQGLLIGLFPNGIPDDATVPIDLRHTTWMIPDPQPRQTVEQEELENRIASSPAVLAREKELMPLAARATAALHNLLSPDAYEAAFGFALEHPGDISIELEPLAWNQLAEITKCLAVRDMLPSAISKQDQELISAHAAWRWFQTLRVPRMAFLSMNKMASTQVEYFRKFKNEPPFTVWSAHDSTLIGLLCAYRLEQPVAWPEYASCLMLELIQAEERSSSRSNRKNNNEKTELFVRFSLNGERLKSHWEGCEALDMIPLAVLEEKIASVGKDTSKVASTD